MPHATTVHMCTYSLQWLPMFKVLEPAKVVGNQMEAITSRTAHDDDSLFVRMLREHLWWSSVAHLTREDDTKLLAQRDSKLRFVIALRFFFLFNYMTGLWWCRFDDIFNRCWFWGYWTVITDITWCWKIKTWSIQWICEMLSPLNEIVIQHYMTPLATEVCEWKVFPS